MSTLVFFLFTLTLLSVVLALGLGIFSMVKGGDFNKKYGNKLMQARVILQGIAILLLVLSMFLSQN